MKFILSLCLTLSIHFLFAQTDTLKMQKDSVFTISGDTLVGKITIDKDHNQYLFITQKIDSLVATKTDSLIAPKTDSVVLSSSKIKRFILFSKENNAERQVFDLVFDSFYLLELGETDAITVYAKHTYNKVTNDGPTYYTIKKKYCLFKNKILYNIKPETLKAELLVLTADCSKVSAKIRQEKIRIDDLSAIITAYNHCF